MTAITLRDLTKVYGNGCVAVDRLNLDVASGELIVLLGPSGCGKTTVLRLIAGLEEATFGHVHFDGQVADQIPTRDREVAMVFQDFGLYPHMNVAENIGFPLRIAQVREDEIAARVTEVAEVLGVDGLLHRMPSGLSGGQAQRVAMARAIIRRPVAFLLDEPLSNVDANLRAELRGEIAALTRELGVTTIYVTHDQTEALSIADRIAVLRRGALEQVGTAHEIYADPANLFVAAYLGLPRINLLQTAIFAGDGETVIDFGAQSVVLPWDDHRARALAPYHTARVTVGIRPDAFALVAPEASEGRRDVLRGIVRFVEYSGHENIVYLDTGSIPTALATTRLELPENDAGLHSPSLGGGAPLPDEAIRLPGDIILRLPYHETPRVGEVLALHINLDAALLFDRVGDRIRIQPPDECST
jgi:multiple sugar transport system ATP-binding protein